MKNSKIPLLIMAFVIPVVCVALGLAGILVFGFMFANYEDANLAASGINREEVEAEVVIIAANYASTGDLNAAREQLNALGLPNADQYISFMVDRYIQENRGQDDVDTLNLFMLADALGSASPSMAAALSTPTPIPTPTLPPTATPLPVDTSTPIPPTEAPVETPTEPPPPTDTPVPTDTPEPPTPTLGPPTNTPEPTPTPEPTNPPIDFVIAEVYLIPNPVYDSCPGLHQIFVTVVDVNSNPLDGVIVEDTFQAVPPKTSGEKGPGKLEYDLWKNGFSLKVTANEDGSPATSEVTPKLSTLDHDIPDDWLIQANYCKDVAECQARKNSNQLCLGHYGYNVTFQKTH